MANAQKLVDFQHLQPTQAGVDMDAMMDGLIHEDRQSIFVTKVESLLGEVSDDQWRTALEAATPDAAWTFLRQSLREAALDTFPRKRDDKEKDIIDARLSLLKERRRLKEELAMDVDVDLVTLHLTWLGRRIHKCANDSRKNDNIDLFVRFWEAWLHRSVCSCPSASLSPCSAELLDEDGRASAGDIGHRSSSFRHGRSGLMQWADLATRTAWMARLYPWKSTLSGSRLMLQSLTSQRWLMT